MKNRYKALERVFAAAAIILSDIMCAAVGYEYSALEWGGRYGLNSAPAYAAFLYAVPFAAGIVICVILSLVFHKKANQSAAL